MMVDDIEMVIIIIFWGDARRYAAFDPWDYMIQVIIAKMVIALRIRWYYFIDVLIRHVLNRCWSIDTIDIAMMFIFG